MGNEANIIGSTGHVTLAIQPGRLGQVMVRIGGGTQPYAARAADRSLTIEEGSSVVITNYHPPQTVEVAPL